MDERKTVTTERHTEVRDTTVPAAAPTTNVNVRPDGGANVQVNDPGAVEGEVVEEHTTTTTRRTP